MRKSTADFFVGRGVELDALGAAFEEALSRRGRVIMLSGEAGIGKSRLAREVAERAGQRGAVVLSGGSHEGEWAPAYGPFVEAITEYVRGAEPGGLRADLGSGAGMVARIVPAVGERLEGIDDPAALQPDEERFRLLDAMSQFLIATSARAPVVLILDDLQWADRGTVALLRHLARCAAGHRVLLIGAYRDGEIDAEHPLTEALAVMRRETSYEGVCLRGLNAAEMSDLVDRLAVPGPGRMEDAEPEHPVRADDEPVANVVGAQTNGNPFLARELIQYLLNEDEIERREGRWVLRRPLSEARVPHGVRQLVELRLRALSRNTNALLRIASAFRGPFRCEIAAKVAEFDEEVGIDAVDEAIRARLLNPCAGTDTYEFAHDLIRQTIYADLNPSRQLRLHRRIAEAMEAEYGERVLEHAVELAYHYCKAANDGVVSDRAIACCLEAAAQATHRLAYDDAARLLEQALRLLDLQPADERRRCEVVLALGEALARSGSTALSKSTFLAAVDLARRTGDAGALAHAALGLADLGWGTPIGIVDEPVVRLLEDAVARLPDENRDVRARLLSRLATQLAYADLFERRLTLTREALDLAEALDDPNLQVEALRARHYALWSPDFAPERRQTAERMLLLAREANDPTSLFHARAWRIVDLFELGDGMELDRELEAATAAAAKLREPRYLWMATNFHAVRALSRGRFAYAERLAEEALAHGERSGDVGAPTVYAQSIFVLRTAQGRLEEVADATRAYLDQFREDAGVRTALALIHAELDRREEAAAEFEHLARDAFRSLPRHFGWLTAMAYLARVCSYLGDPERSAVLYDNLRPFADRHVAIIQACTLYEGPVPYYLGLLAATQGQWDLAMRHFAQALEMSRSMGARHFDAYTRYAQARALLGRGQLGDLDTVRTLLDAALTSADELGMKRLADQVRELSDRLPGAGLRSPAVPAGAAAVFRNEGDFWTIVFGGTTIRLKGSKGLDYLAVLLRHPSREFHAVDLSAEVEVGPSDAARLRRDAAQAAGMSVARLDGAGPVHDPKARGAYKQRLEELRAELAEAEGFNDAGRVGKLRAEMEALLEELEAGTGLAGRSRTSASPSERARLNVTRAIKTAVQRISALNRPLADHLRRSLKTGIFCSYDPDPQARIDWEF